MRISNSTERDVFAIPEPPYSAGKPSAQGPSPRWFMSVRSLSALNPRRRRQAHASSLGRGHRVECAALVKETVPAEKT